MTEKKELYRIRIEAPGLTLERDVSQDVGARIVLLILDGVDQRDRPASVPEVAAAVPTAMRDEQPRKSLPEFLNDSQARRNPDKIVAIATYLREYDQRKTFNLRDVVAGFELAAEQQPGNV